ncbi:hypothetical protein MA16_Dca001835 [Dendrobium catenatum]|uniref:Uncharacterized protein n=1 Tax=Dendrobium catenatum TaxID=906689 RepID=A0A2I0XDN3_9ASPA|nr:hypothetical protein MA16_Dca001835 [Dendrobium catenatum]
MSMSLRKLRMMKFVKFYYAKLQHNFLSCTLMSKRLTYQEIVLTLQIYKDMKLHAQQKGMMWSLVLQG